ncbi:hypothetical protein [Streptomyces acidicola]|uniref:hypothetical protein n=1 Tax=Streptomyces acidicola TaxID=2596892 RepID=UPI003419A262
MTVLVMQADISFRDSLVFAVAEIDDVSVEAVTAALDAVDVVERRRGGRRRVSGLRSLLAMGARLLPAHV